MIVCACAWVVVRQTLAAALRSDVDVMSSLEVRMALYQAVGRLCDKVRARMFRLWVAAGVSWTATIVGAHIVRLGRSSALFMDPCWLEILKIHVMAGRL